MAQRLRTSHHDVVVVGGGAAGIAAAVAAQRSGLNTVLIETGTFFGGELVSGLPIDGCLNAKGQWIVGGLARELFDEVERLGSFARALCDHRQMWGVCLDPEMMKIAIIQAVAAAGIDPRLYTTVTDVAVRAGRVTGVNAVAKGRQYLITGDVFIDATGDGHVATTAGAPYEFGGKSGELQPVSLTYRMGDVDYAEYLDWVVAEPEHFLLAENPALGHRTKADAAAQAAADGYPFVALSATDTVLGEAIANGEVSPATALYLWPTSPARREVGLNTTRLAGVNGMSAKELSRSMGTLTSQITSLVEFCRAKIPGFSQAHLAGISPRVGVRETRRVMGEHVLTEDDVVTGRKSPRGIGKGGHHVDIHGAGTAQVRRAVQDGQSYDIPYQTLIPKGLTNVLVAGRCFSSTREANGSARVMGTCMAMGEAAGLAASLMHSDHLTDTRQVDVATLRQQITAYGGVVDGTD